MSKTENQLDYVRQNLNDIPRKDWPALAVSADVPYRSLYKFANPKFVPLYDTVYSLCKQIKEAKKKMKRGSKCAQV